MKKYLSCCFFLFSCAALFGQVNVTELVKTNEGWKKKGDSTLFSGDFAEYYENGKIKGTGRLKAGKLDGYRVTYYENGNRLSMRNYAQGVVNGDAKEYHENGKLKQEGMFTEGKEDGVWQVYHENGKLYMLIHFRHGKREGEYLEYDPTGELRKKYIFEGDRPGYGDKIETMMQNAIGKTAETKFKEAIRIYDDMIRLNPTIPQVWFNKATNHLNVSELEEAVKNYTRAIVLDTGYTEAYAKRGEVRILLFNTRGILEPTPAQTKEACEDFYKAKELGDKTTGTDEMIRLYCNKK